MIKVNDDFKIDLRTYGRQFDVKLKVNDIDMSSDNLNYIKPAFYSTLFKTIMHQIEIDSNIYIPVNAKINGKIGVKLNEKKYNYIDLNTYYVKSCERQEDTNSYRILAYTKMQEAMIENKLNLSEKLTVRNYLIKICNKLNWDTTNIPKTFINSEKLLDPTLHTGIGYTYRDILDEIATITCSFLLFKGEELYLIYPAETNESIDETYLDEDNITIGDLFFINSLVFARAEESDNIYRKDDESIQENGLHEFRISDNQLLSTNDRDLYIDEMFNYLRTLNFYTFDVQSKGILFLEPCDIFDFVLSGITYKTILLNNEIDLEDGLTEKLYTDKPEETETEYKYADTTDKKINKTYILVDKQNKKITQLTTEVAEHEDKITQVEQDVDGITQKVENIVDTTRSVSGLKTIKLEKCIKGYLIKLRILGNNAVFKRLYPANDLYPSDVLYPLGDSRIIVTDAENNSKMYELRVPDVLRANEETQDEYILENNFAKVIRRVNEDGTTKVTPKEEVIGKYTIYVAQGDNTITIQNYNASIEAVFVQQNAYTDQFATKVEMTSAIQQSAEQVQSKVNKTLKDNYSTTQEMESTITQTAEEINTEVKKKVGENEIISKINQSAEQIQIDANKISLKRKRNKFDSRQYYYK